MWCRIHDFFQGWGMATEDHQKIIFFRDVYQCYKRDITEFPGERNDFFWDNIYASLKKYLVMRSMALEEKWKKNPPKWDKISIPKINKPFPKLNLVEVFSVQPMRRRDD